MTSAPVLVVDVANVMGSRADGWWRDRAGAARRLVDQVRSGGLDHEVVLVLEGKARAGVEESDAGRWRVVHARTDGDDTVVEQAGALTSQGRQVLVVTADRELRNRVAALGGVECRGPRWFLDRLS